ncbi:MAG: CHAT domain-containing protein [Acidobacteria bacterium]|nr:CHAT domain-containing protein [Acidobacteriota bacterium]
MTRLASPARMAMCAVIVVGSALLSAAEADTEQARDLLRQAESQLSDSRLIDAADTFQRAGEAFLLAAAPSDAARCWIRAATALDAAGRTAEALEPIERARTILADDGEPGQLVTALNQMGAMLLRLGRNEESLSVLSQALEFAPRSPNPLAVGAVCNSIGNVYLALGDTPHALASYDRAASTFEAQGAVRPSAQVRTNMGAVYRDMAEFAKAREVLEQALATFRALRDEAGEAGALNNLGLVDLQTGSYESARARFAESLNIREKLGDSMNAAAAATNLGLAHYWRGDYAEALQAYAEALETYRRAGHRQAEATLLNDIGAVHLRVSDTALAREKLEEALAIRRQLGNPREIADSLDNIASIYRDRGDLRSALDGHQEALAMYRKAGDRHGEAGALHNLGESHAASGQQVTAYADFGEALRIRREIGDRQGIAATLLSAGRLRYQDHKPQAALTDLVESVQIAESLSDLPTLWEGNYLIGKIHNDIGKADEAIRFYEKSVETIQRIRVSADALSVEPEQFLSDKSKVFEELVDLLLSRHREKDALRYVQLGQSGELLELYNRARSRPASEEERQVQSVQSGLQANEFALVRSIQEEQSRGAPDQEKITRIEAELDAARIRLAAFVDELEASPQFDSLTIRPMELERIQKYLTPGTMIIAPMMLPERLVTFVVTPDLVTYRTADVRAEVVAAEISRLRKYASRPSRKDTGATTFLPAARRLYDWIISPVERDLHSVRVLMVSPTSRLRYVPFQALFDGKQFLVEKFRIVNLTSLGALEVGRSQSRGTPHVLAFGNPDGSLPEADVEVRAIAEIVPGTKGLLHEHATKAALRSEVRGHDVVHMATHGVLDADLPTLSYILFADKEGMPGRLGYSEIPALDFRSCRLVVLSACETALGARSEGGEISGLAYQFQRAGASAIVATLWLVSDEATARLMRVFYEKLVKGASASTALQEAQLSVRRDPATSHPFFWAPFIILGGAEEDSTGPR